MREGHAALRNQSEEESKMDLKLESKLALISGSTAGVRSALRVDCGVVKSAI